MQDLENRIVGRGVTNERKGSPPSKGEEYSSVLQESREASRTNRPQKEGSKNVGACSSFLPSKNKSVGCTEMWTKRKTETNQQGRGKPEGFQRGRKVGKILTHQTCLVKKGVKRKPPKFLLGGNKGSSL